MIHARPCGAGRRLATAAAALVLLGGCASARPTSRVQGPEGARGYRALFRGETDGPAGKERFRMAAALLPPDRLRLEFSGPVGGPRLVVAVDGATVMAILPSERAYDSEPAGAAVLDRILGLPLAPAQLVALLTGQPMCDADKSEQQVQTKAAATFGRTLAWVEVTCPPDDIRYEGRSAERGGILKEASVREGISGAMILEVEYDDHEDGLGPRWPHRIRIRLPRRKATVELAALEGPVAGDMPGSLFSPPVPDGFEKRSLLASLSAPGLLGSTADRER